jgi:hypothetical protein
MTPPPSRTDPTPTEKPSCARPRQQITLRLRLADTAGFGYDISNANLNRFVETTRFP